MYPRHKLDLGTRDALQALAASALARGPARHAARAVAAWGAPPGETVVCLSVRTGFDLLLEAVAFPEGSEVLLSAITHPELERIVRRHGLRPVPVDVDPATLAPSAQALEAAAGPRARMLVVAHLFGGRADLSAAAELARSRGLLLVEDCAQSFRGPGDCGDPRADVSMFSFGPIKTATALGAALLRVRDRGLRERIAALEEGFPRQSRRAYAARALKFLGLTIAARPVVFGLLFRAAGRVGVDLDALLVSAVRGFAPAPGEEATEAGRRAFHERFRRRPSAPLLAVLARRLERFDHVRLARRAALGAEVVSRLPPALVHPGGEAVEPTHWVVPVVPGDPERLVAELRRAGFDASRGTSSIVAVPPPADRPELAPRRSAALLASVVFLPVCPELPAAAVERLLDRLHAFESARSSPPAAVPERHLQAGCR